MVRIWGDFCSACAPLILNGKKLTLSAADNATNRMLKILFDIVVRYFGVQKYKNSFADISARVTFRSAESPTHKGHHISILFP